MQSDYVLEDFGDRKQISRFNEDGNRIVLLKVESFVEDIELKFILTALNTHLKFYREPYQSPDSEDSLNLFFK